MRQWCEDATAASRAAGGPAYRFVHVDQEGFEQHTPATMAALTISCTGYHEL